jgi:hypothetical protein
MNRLRLLQPSWGVGIADQVEEPPQDCGAVSTANPESDRVRRKLFDKGARRLGAASESVGDNLANGLRVLAIGQEIGCDPRRAGDREPLKDGPLFIDQLAAMGAHVGSANLPPFRQRELMRIRRKVAEAVQSSRRPMRHYPLGRLALPGGNGGCELQPGRPQWNVVREGRPCQVVHAVGYSLQ